MLDSAVRLFREHGYNGTGFRDVVAHRNSPRGSIYAHFPGGKAQLGVEAVESSGRFINGLIEQGVEGEDFVVGFERFWRWWIRFIEADDFQAGCPVVGVAVEAHPEAPELADAASRVFSDWEGPVAISLRRAGVPRAERASAPATSILAALVGSTA